ncbi:acetyltransferase (GNAT) domain protein [Bacteriovorax sp. DB6_IX]|nr:acetyltransferase (GNAT) domain protein [Bacteriovorax sp. DB6_IX]
MLLRRFLESDLEDICEMESDFEVMKSTGPAKTFTYEESQKRLDKIIRYKSSNDIYGYWALVDSELDKVVAWFMLIPIEEEYPEIGFMVNRKFWKKGLAFKGIEKILEKAKEEKVSRIVARVNRENLASIKTLEKAEFKIQKENEKIFFFVIETLIA